MQYFSIQEEIQLISETNDIFHNSLELPSH